ncbi:MAG: DUF368 domain-containing protein [Planctomycetota bacterium]|nr:DUF368 domain-containing protein [Planctomycetota bacterium]
MGLANLVPGISGGTMLLATGIYDRFITAVSQITTLRFRWPSLLVLATIIIGGGCAIVGGAEVLGTLVHEQRWIMFSLFIGLTLGGIPLIWSMIRPLDGSAAIGCLIGFLFMALLAWVDLGGGTPGDTNSNWLILLVAGAAAGATMVLPGVSGSYILLVLGQYLVILSAITTLKDGLRGDAEVTDAMTVLVPVAIGAALGVVVVSNVMQWFLQNARKTTLGVLMGFLLGAVLGLWPYYAPVDEGTLLANYGLSAPEIEELRPRDWPVETFSPSAGQIGAGIGLVILGFGISLAISMMGREASDPDHPDQNLPNPE